MRKAKFIFNLILGLVILVIITATSVNAAGIPTSKRSSDLESFFRTETFLLTHPAAAANMSSELAKGNQKIVSKYFSNSQDQEFYLRSENLINTITNISKTAYITRSPQNTERNIIPTILVSPQGSHTFSTSKFDTPRQFSILAINSTDNAINIDPFLVYKNSKNELIVWGVMKNNSGIKIVVNSVPYIELSANGKKLAFGDNSSFQQPMKLAPYEVKANLGIHDGLPHKCFIKMVFEPGAYDGTADISNLDNLSCSYTLDYEPLQ